MPSANPETSRSARQLRQNAQLVTVNSIMLARLLASSSTRLSPRALSGPFLSRSPFTVMPPKKAPSTSKRKLSSSPEDEEPEAVKRPKTNATGKGKAKEPAADSGDTGIGPNGQPTNKVMPVNIEFPKKTPGTLRFASWNICGLAAAQKKVRNTLSPSHAIVLTDVRSGLQILR